jgi:hypothetical protein
MKGGHIVNVEMLTDLSDQEAIEKSHDLYAATRRGQYDGFELWDRARVVIRHEGQKPPVSSQDPTKTETA